MLVALAAVGIVAFSSLHDVQSANDQVFSDNFRTAEATNQLTTDLSAAERLSLELAATRGGVTASQLAAKLEEIAIPRVTADIAKVLALHRGDSPAERAALKRIPAEWAAVEPVFRAEVLGTADRTVADPVAARAVARIGRAVDPLLNFVSGRQPREGQAAAAAHVGAQSTYHDSRTWLIIAATIALLAAITMLRVGASLKRLVDEQNVEQEHGESESEYIDTLQVTENEDEAQELLRRQVERTVGDSRAVVLARNNSADRLEARTSLAEIGELREPLSGAQPRACLAVRFGRSHTEGVESRALTHCAVCGGLPGTSTCEPLLVSGEVMGAVLINHVRPPSERQKRLSREAVAQAAPVLANLRNLAIAEMRAATDALTGLPNQRAIQDTLKRMVAQASRTITPLAALLIDLDHFKQINDIYGHDRGDEALAAAGVALRNVIRESDFAGRYGGEEFLALLPATDKVGALQVAEAVRASIASIQIPAIDRPITASVGVAILPDDGGDGVTLFRSADRALYAAKTNGRNRVETAAAADANDELSQAASNGTGTVVTGA